MRWLSSFFGLALWWQRVIASPTNLGRSLSLPTFPGWTGPNCYEDNRNFPNFHFPLLTGAYFVDTTGMTIEECFAFCENQTQPFRFAGLTDGFQCSCDNFYEFILENVGNSACDTPCRGNSSELGGCGGPFIASVYQNMNVNVVIPSLVQSVGP
ncbi:hypothetical protein BC834DRAFT_303942 [Gloeopeniophorella convolvens]|nr:hypothetical protein BC834DRAFT_303942 [Gloeopeniophorella convolvens]